MTNVKKKPVSILQEVNLKKKIMVLIKQPEKISGQMIMIGLLMEKLNGLTRNVRRKQKNIPQEKNFKKKIVVLIMQPEKISGQINFIKKNII